MSVLSKERWKVTASSGDPRLAIDDHYATTWISEPSKKPWLKIDLGETATLGGLEVYWGKQCAGSLWIRVLAGRQDLDPSLSALATAKADRTSLPSLPSPPDSCAGPATTRNRSEGMEIVEINLYGPARRGVGEGRGAHRGARPFPGQAPVAARASRSISAMSDLRSGR